MMIPKIIHYCWFGKNPLPKSAKKCIKSWKRFCPDFKIIEWNEDNFDINTCPEYVIQAYNNKKWAFVTDYVRLKVVYEYGGIYMDTDVELVKNIEFLLEYDGYFGFERNYVATGLGFGAIKGLEIVREMMDDYNNLSFINEKGEINLVPCPKLNTKIFEKHGLLLNNEKQIIDENILVLPMEYFSPVEYATHKLHKTKNTVSIHWYMASWHSQKQKSDRLKRRKNLRKKERREIITIFIKKTIRKILGNKIYEFLKNNINT